jgi:hypothetical protein
MPRNLRIEYEGAMYHVLNRGDRREPIFRDDADRKRFLRDHGWSSCPEYLKPPTRRWSWLRGERWLGEMRLPKDSTACRRELEQQMEVRRPQETGGEEWVAIRRGRFFGADHVFEISG